MVDDDTLVPREDLDDIIGEAARRKQVAEESLTVAEIEEVAAELDIDESYVEAAVRELQRRKERAEKERERAEKRSQRMRKGARIGFIGVAVLCLVAFGISYSRLNSKLSAAEQKRAQVENVVERQVETEEQYAGQPTSIEKNASLEGAENRVRIEIRRYDEAASSYNRSARGFPGGVVRAFVGMPESLPLSNEIEQW
jgi:hypothetical protein